MNEQSELMKEKDVNKLIKFYEENNQNKGYDLNEVIPSVFKNLDDYKKFMHDFTIRKSIKDIKKGLGKDELLSVYVNFASVLDELINEWFERVFELFTLYYPEASIKVQDLPNFSNIKTMSREALSKALNINPESMGIDFSKEDKFLLDEAKKMLDSLMNQKKSYESRIEVLVEEVAFNTAKVAGHLVAAKLIAAAGGLKRLSRMPSSTIQVLGAEKALFRHLRSRKSKPPKHGIIFYSKYVNTAALNHRGKMARALASKISISSKVDYYKGEEVWQKLVKGLEAKMRGLK